MRAPCRPRPAPPAAAFHRTGRAIVAPLRLPPSAISGVPAPPRCAAKRGGALFAAPTDPPTPASAASALAGTWLADYRASSNRGPLLSALGLTGLAKVTADRLIEGVRLSVAGRRLTYRILTVVPFVSPVENIDLGGAVLTGPRRDGAPGTQRVSAAVAGDGRLAVSLTWGAPRAATLVETYSVQGDDTLTVDAVLTPAGGGRPVSARTLYRRAAAWKPKFAYPGGGSASRRALLAAGLTAAAAAAVVPPPAAAAPPAVLLGGPPPPPTFPRRTLDRALAVLLLRSCYDALDGLDVVAMDGWQARFWQLRADRYTSYLNARAAAGAPTRPSQGDVTDAGYFDYISWAQWSAVDLALIDAVAGGVDAATAGGFDEACDPDTDPGCPPAGTRRFAAGAGARILAGLRAGFQGASFDGVPSASPATAADAAPALKALASVLVSRGYALAANVSATPTTITLRCDGPATLWGVRARAAAGAPPNDLAAVVGSALLADVAVGAPSVTASDTATVATWRLAG